MGLPTESWAVTLSPGYVKTVEAAAIRVTRVQFAGPLMGAMRSVVKIRYEVDADENEDDWYASSSEEGMREVAIAALRPEGVHEVLVDVVLSGDSDDLELIVTGQNQVQLFGHYIDEESSIYEGESQSEVQDFVDAGGVNMTDAELFVLLAEAQAQAELPAPVDWTFLQSDAFAIDPALLSAPAVVAEPLPLPPPPARPPPPLRKMSALAFPPLPSLPTINPVTCPLDAFKLNTAELISNVLGVPLQKAFDGIESGRTGKMVKGDFTVAMPRFRLQGDVKALAQKVVDEFKPNGYMASAEVAGTFIHFNMNTQSLMRLVMEQINTLTYLAPPPTPSLTALSLADAEPKPSHLFKTGGYGSNTTGEGKNLIVEFSSPNIAKPFHAGHLRSTIIGAFLGNLYEANGWDVMRMNYLGDWGKQFGLLAVGFEKYGSEEELKADAITHLYQVYVKINADGTKVDAEGKPSETGVASDPTVHDRAREFFVKMEDGDKDAVALWKKFRDLSIVKYKDAYARLNIHFDIYSGESQVSHAGQTAAIEQLSTVGITEESKGALIVDLEKYKLGKTILRKQDGTYVYITRDIAGAAERWDKYKFDKMIYVVASQQDLHLAQFFKVLELMKYPWADRLTHVNFGMVLGMSTRKGTAVFLDQILNESRDVMHDQMRKNEAKYNAVDDPLETSDKLGITAVKIQDMAAKRVNNYKFEWARMTSFEGDTGPYLQYAHVRLCSVERKNAPGLVLPPPSERAATINTDLLVEPSARAIVQLLATYPDVVKAAFINLEPATIVTWCFRLTHAISSAWETLIVKDQPQDVAMARLWLYVATKDVLASAMKLLTLEPLQKM
ncbi:hypothetical protein RQP46_004942 [Phenoliferia psychrophenolica]